jgi:hypothetical protein
MPQKVQNDVCNAQCVFRYDSLYKEQRGSLGCHVELKLHHSFRQLFLLALQPLTVK